MNLRTKSKEEITELASYQFGRKIAEALLKDSEIKGKYPYRKIFENNIQLGMISEKRGIISLTLDGARKINSKNNYFVNIDNDFEIKGSVLAPGVLSADELIRIGDEVFIFKNNYLMAVGVAQMNGKTMTKSNYGEAVKVRHKI